MIKKVVLVVILLVIGLFAYSLITRTMEAVKSGERLSKSADQLYKLEAQNKLLKGLLTQVKSPDYIEEEVRNKLGFVKKGETIVVIPEEKLKLVLGASQSAVIRLPNWLGWLKVFFK